VEHGIPTRRTQTFDPARGNVLDKKLCFSIYAANVLDKVIFQMVGEALLLSLVILN
jgi:hypothetical protein